MPENTSVSETPLVSPDRVGTILQGVLRAALLKGWTDEALGDASGLKPRTIKSYRVDGKQPPLANALSLVAVLGSPAVNAILSVIQYGGARPLDEIGKLNPMEVVAQILPHVSTIAQASADNRIDHLERPSVMQAADMIIATVAPLSSAGDAA